MMGSFARRLAPFAGAFAFAVATGMLAWRLWRLRYFGVWIDESDNVVIGWLLSEGERLYGTLFSHHMPLAYMAGHLVALLSARDDLAHFRLLPPLAYVATGLAFVGSPLAARAADRGWVAGALFVAATGLFAPIWSGTLLVTDVLWGCAFVASAASLWLPLCLARPPSRGRALFGGAALGVWVSGSLITVYPLLVQGLVLGVLLSVSSRHRAVMRRALAAAALGAAGVAAFELIWMLRHAEFGGFVEQALLFNFRFYGPAQGHRDVAGGAFGVLWGGVSDTVRIWAQALSAPRRADPATWFAALAVAVSVGLGVAIARSVSRGRRAALPLAVVAMLILAASLRLRGEGFHAAPYYLWLLGGAAAGVCLLGEASRLGVAAGAMIVAGLITGPAWGSLRLDWNEPDLRRTLGRMLPTFEYVRAHTLPDQRFLSLNVEPLGYLLARRHPAHPAVFYLPWQAAWERSRNEPDSCARARAESPPFVFYAPQEVQGHPWLEFGSCFDALVRERYERVLDPQTRDLWRLRQDAVGQPAAASAVAP
jgi:hypothetical protein